MLGLARFAALAVLFALAGCVTTENSLSQNDIASMKLTGVTVSFAPEAGIQWEDGIRAYATSRAISDHEIATATNTPEGKAYVRDMLAPRIKAGVEQAMAGQLNGSRPVRVVMVGNGIVGTAVQAAIDSASTQSPADKLIGVYGQNYRDWLVRRT